MNKSYLNSRTGICVKEKDLPDTLVHFSKKWPIYEPRTWAIENISPDKTIKKLTESIVFFDPAQKMNFPIAPKVNSPEARLVDGSIAPIFSAKEILNQYKR